MPKQPQNHFHQEFLTESSHFLRFWCIPSKATTEISSSSENINHTVRVFRLSFRFWWLWYHKLNNLQNMQISFFLSACSFRKIDDSQDSRERGRLSLLTHLYHFHLLHRHLDISRTITAESSPLHIASNRIRTENFWFPNASR